MKTPDEIKQYAQAWREALVDDCIDFPYAVHTMLHTAADVVETLLTELEQVKRERDAAVEVVSRYRNCDVCTHMNEGGLMCTTCKYPSLVDVYPTFRPNWEWCGVQKEVE